MTAFKVVKRTGWRRDSYGHKEEFCYQQLVRITRWGPFGWFRREDVLDTEEVPQHVMISLGCFGDTGGWTSKWADLVSAQNALRRAQENARNGFDDKTAQARERLRTVQQEFAARYA